MEIHVEYFFPDKNIETKYYLIEEILWDKISKSEYKDIFSGCYSSLICIITYILCLLCFKFFDCLYFLRIQSWRIKTILKAVKLLLSNICILFVIVKFENIFYRRDSFAYAIEEIKRCIMEIDYYNKKNNGEKNATYNLILFLTSDIANVYNIFFKIVAFIIFKVCIYPSLKCYFYLKFLNFLVFRNKYTIPYFVIYTGMLMLILPNYNFLIIPQLNEYNDASDFISFCYVLILITCGYLFLYLYYIKISLMKRTKRRKKEVKIRIFFLCLLTLGLAIMLSNLLQIIKLQGNLCKFIII